MFAKRALTALAATVFAACTSAPAREVKEPDIYQRPGIRDYEHISAVTSDHRVAVFYERATAALIEEYAGRVFAGQVDALAAELNRQAAIARVGNYVSRQVRSAAPSGGGAPVSGACTGGPVSSTVVQNESGGDPNNWNDQGSGAWGCWQIMPGTWAGLGCEGAHGSASVDQQRECANKVYAEQGRGAWTAAG